MELDFKGKNVLITGATRGIGKSISDLLYLLGANLLLTGTKKNEIDILNNELLKKKIHRKQYIQVDFSDKQSLNNFLKFLDSQSKIDVCINNAGVNKIGDFISTTDEDYNWMYSVNIEAPHKILRVVGPKMIANEYGRVVNIASIWSVITRPGRSLYSSTKNALVGLTKSLSVEWAQHNVLVNAVSPGFTLTELTKETNTKEQLMEIEKLIPMKRMADPSEMANIITFLASDKNTYLTGQNITIDGGYTNV